MGRGIEEPCPHYESTRTLDGGYARRLAFVQSHSWSHFWLRSGETMSLTFYVHGQDETFDKCYGNYTNNQSWNQASSGDPASFTVTLEKANTTEGLTEILTCKASQFMLGKAKIQKQAGGAGKSEAVALLDLVGSSEASVIVLKGVHQMGNPHVSLGYAGWIYHVDVKSGRQGQSNLFTVTGVSEGTQVRDSADGWTAVKK